MTKAWITRTRPAAETTAKAVQDIGFETVIAPLLRIAPPENIPPTPPDDAILIFTSSNGVRAFCALKDRRVWPVVTVGDSTAELAKSFGFANVQSASGASEEVTQLIKTQFTQQTPIFHAAGKIVRGTIVEDLTTAGYTTERHVFYQAEATDHIPDVDDIEYVLLHSPLAAQILVEAHVDCAQVTAICMSEAVRSALGTLALREIRVAIAPTEAALLACLPR